jgi:CheY-like chemotaxis protein
VQCISNVLTNAAKYTDPNGTICVESHREAGIAVITVSDNGPGIAPDLLPHVFELFVQGQRTLDRAQGGLGIGLSVVKRIVDMHGGEVRAWSAGPGQGATVEIRLPLVDPAQTERENAPARGTPATRILIVDDNHDAAESLGLLLSLDGHDVHTVHAAREVLERARYFKPHIILLDIGLPEIDGFEVARRLRAAPEFSGVKIVALTGYGQTEDRRRTEAAGFDAHLVKPADLGTLQKTLERLT